MIKSVNIDGEDYIIKECAECPFFHDGCWEYAQRCQHPANAREITEAEFNDLMIGQSIAEGCPLTDYIGK